MSTQYKMLEELGLDRPALPTKEYRKMGRKEEWDYVRSKWPEIPKSFLAKVDFQRRGMNMSKEAVDFVQDVYYAKGPRILFQWHHEDYTEPVAIPFTMILNDGTTIAIQTCPPDIGDPYTMDVIDGTCWVLSDGEKMEEVTFPKAPVFEMENKVSSKGVPFTHLGWLSGTSCMLLIPNSHCQYWNENLQCRFCDMDYNTRQAMKMGRGWKVRLTGEDMYELISESLKEKGRWYHVLITGGSNPKENYERELSQEIELLQSIRKAGQDYGEYYMPINLIATPYEEEQYQRLKEAGLDAFGCYFETWTKEHFELVCPGKAKYIGYEPYIDKTLKAVDVFGEGNVTAGFVPGVEMAPPPYGFAEVDEAVNSTLEGYDFLIRNKVVPIGTNWCINPGSDFYKMGAVQPPLEFYAKLDLGRYRLLMKHWNGRLSADQMGWKFQPLGCYPDYQRLL